MKKWNVELVNIELKTVLEFPGNSQIVPEDKMMNMRHYMEAHGWTGQMPLAWMNLEDGKTYWISGHHRCQAAIDVGITHRMCELICDEDYKWDQAKKDLLMYNNVHGAPDLQMEKLVIESLLDSGIDPELLALDIGKNMKEMDDILKDLNFLPSPEDEQPKLDEKKKIVCPSCGEEFTQ